MAKVYDLLKDENPDNLEEAQRVYEEAMNSEDAEDLLDEIKESKHYTLDPDMTYISMLNAAKNNSFNREKLQAAFNRIEESDELFNGLFADVDLYSNRLGTGQRLPCCLKIKGGANSFKGAHFTGRGCRSEYVVTKGRKS